jgi:hypothetical protein
MEPQMQRRSQYGVNVSRLPKMVLAPPADRIMGTDMLVAEWVSWPVCPLTTPGGSIQIPVSRINKQPTNPAAALASNGSHRLECATNQTVVFPWVQRTFVPLVLWNLFM